MTQEEKLEMAKLVKRLTETTNTNGAEIISRLKEFAAWEQFQTNREWEVANFAKAVLAMLSE